MPPHEWDQRAVNDLRCKLRPRLLRRHYDCKVVHFGKDLSALDILVSLYIPSFEATICSCCRRGALGSSIDSDYGKISAFSELKPVKLGGSPFPQRLPNRDIPPSVMMGASLLDVQGRNSSSRVVIKRFRTDLRSPALLPETA